MPILLFNNEIGIKIGAYYLGSVAGHPAVINC